MNLKKIDDCTLLALSRGVLNELRRRGLIRTANAPAGDYAELLVQRAVCGELAPNSKKSWDVLTPQGERLQVKARIIRNQKARGQRQLSTFRSLEFDALVIVLFDNDFAVWKASKIPIEALKAELRADTYVAGFRIYATDDFLQKGEDWTESLQQASTQSSC